MKRAGAKLSNVVVRPLTPSLWKDFETLFGPNGACAGCWCMWWKLSRSEFAKRKGVPNKNAMRKRVDSGETPGFLAYLSGEPVGWCAVEPREAYPSLARSRVLAPIDERKVLSIPCFFVKKDFRRRGLSSQILKAVAAHFRETGGAVLEGYPVEPKKPTADVFVFTGLASSFTRAGFREVARRSRTRPIMRRVVRATAVKR